MAAENRGLLLALVVYTIWKAARRAARFWVSQRFFARCRRLRLYWLDVVRDRGPNDTMSPNVKVSLLSHAPVLHQLMLLKIVTGRRHWPSLRQRSPGRPVGEIFAEAQGNESLARANYLTARSRQLADTIVRKCLSRRGGRTSQARRRSCRIAEEQRRYDALPKDVARLRRDNPVVSGGMPKMPAYLRPEAPGRSTPSNGGTCTLTAQCTATLFPPPLRRADQCA